MSRLAVRAVIVAVIFTFVGVAGAAAAYIYIPQPGTAPSIYDTFRWDSISDGFWHVNSYGATATIDQSMLDLKGHMIELDHLLQTDPARTIIVARVRGLAFHRFALGIGSYHGGTLTLEYDDDGMKCSWGTGQGQQIDIMKAWTKPPVGKWRYLEVAVDNPYPGWSPHQLSTLNYLTEKPLGVTCMAYDAKGHLISSVHPTSPEPNAHYVSLDEAFFRTWDSANNYQIDWVYAGPPSGNPASRILSG
ncbi:MAG: hypothetical protein ACRDFS_13425 [Chloroflexota bacterium]